MKKSPGRMFSRHPGAGGCQEIGCTAVVRSCCGRDAHYGATPRTEPDVPNSGIRLPPRVSDGEALFGPRMSDAGFGQASSDQAD